jgi:TPR repeat protein
MGMIKMSIRLSQSFGIGILALIVLSSPAALADPAGDMARAQEALNREDITEAAKIFRQAAEQNYVPAQVGLGELMHTTQEYEEAVGWFIMAAYQGDAAGAYDLGQMYAVGEGVEKNSEKALYWFKFAANKNYLPAVEILATAYRNGDFGLTIDLDQAKNWESKLPALRAAAKKITDQEFAASMAAKKAAYEAAVAKAAAKKGAAKKSDDEAAVKKVDDEDEATAKKAAEKTEPVQAK